MKPFVKIGLVLAAGFVISACQDTDTETGSYLNTPFVSPDIENHVFQDVPSTVKRNVLVEDFTGHKCGYCPDAARIIESLQNVSPYKEQLFAVAIHGNGDFNSYTPGADQFYYDFSTPEGIEIDGTFGASAASLPQGTVNRDGDGKVDVLPRNVWKSVADKYINEIPVAWVDVYAKVQPGPDKYINISSRIKFLADYPNDVNFNVVLVENKIINWQKDYASTPEVIPDYEHNHVLRYNHEADRLNLYGTWGRELESHSQTTDLIQRVSTSYKDTDWNVDNMEAIAYIYDVETREILQVNKVHVKK